MAVPVVESSTVNSLASSSSLAINVPSGAVSGDVLVLFLEHGSARTLTAPSGWTEIASAVDIVPSAITHVLWRAVSSEPSSYTFNLNNITFFSGVMIRISGALVSDPFDSGWNIHGPSLGFVASAPSPSITTLGNDRLILRSMNISSVRTLVHPSGTTLIQSTSYQGVAWSNLLSQGSTGTATWSMTSSNTNTWVLGTFAIAPAVSGGGGASVAKHAVYYQRRRAG
jgi:hypothetical protein